MTRTTGNRRTNLGFARLTAGALVVAAVPAAVGAPTGALVQDPVLSWARSAVAFDGESVGNGVAVDGAGGSIVTGSFENRITLGDGDRAVELISNGFDDLFVARYDAAGQLDWALSVGSSSRDFGAAVDLDAAGNIYVTGEVWSQALFGAVPVPAGAFVAKYDAGGGLLWVRGEAGLFGVEDAAVDSTGNVFVTGSFTGTIAFGEGADEVTLTPRSIDGDVFVAAYQPDGDLAWARDAGGTGKDRGAGVAVNDQGDVVVGGWFTGAAEFDSGVDVALPAAEDVGAFVAMYDSAGNLRWVRVGESVFAEARDVAVDATGRATLVGRFSDSVSFGGASATVTAPQFTTGVFVASFAIDGTPTWVASGTTESGFPDGWSVDTDGTSVVVAGEFSGEDVTFDDGAATVTIDNVNSSPDAFVASFTSAGAISWARGDGGAYDDAAYGVAIGPGSVTMTGQFQYTATFGDGDAAVTLGSDTSNAKPIFLARYSTTGESPTRIVLPSRLAASGSSTVRVVGAGLVPGTTFELVGPGGEVRAPIGAVDASGQLAQARFDLSGATLGTWSVRLIVPGEGESLLEGAITVVAPGAGDDDPIGLSLSVRDVVRDGRPFIATLTVFNRTDRDLAGVPLVLDGLPTGTVVEPEFPTFDLPDEPIAGLAPPAEPTELPLTLTDPTGIVWFPLLTGRIPAGGRVDLPVRVTVPSGTSTTVDMSLHGCEPAYDGTNDPLPPADSPEPGGVSIECLKDIYVEVVEQALEIVPGSGCVADAAKSYVAEQIVELMFDRTLREAAASEPGTAVPGTEVTEDIVDLVASCLSETIAVSKAARAAVALWEIFRAVQEAEELIETCLPPIPPSRRQVGVVNSVDPNDKVGPDGTGPEGFTNPDVPFDYSIYFENLDSATAAAQRVVISDAIDTTVFDPGTIELGAITLGSTIVGVPPPGVREWSDVVEFGHPDLLLGIDVEWDDATATLTWTLDTIDRGTGLPTDDPLAGFLPPNVLPPEGEGSVRLLIEPRTRADGAQLSNEASIVFDANEPIATGPWTNTLDGTAPDSTVSALPAVSGSTAVPLSWTASDATSGVELVEVWVQQDGGVPELWRIAGATVSSATFDGADGSTYAFWTRAWDRAGNVEPPPGDPDTVTTIRLDQPPTADGQVVTTSQDTDAAIVLTATDPDGDALTYEVVDAPDHGSLLGTAPDLIYRPAPGFTGTDSFTFRASDGELNSAPATVTIEVVPRGEADSISIELVGRSTYRNEGELLSGDLMIGRDARGIADVSGSGAIEGVGGGLADVSITITRLGWTRLYLGTMSIDDAGAGPGGLNWTGRLLGSAVADGPDGAEGIALAIALTRPGGLHLLRWHVTDGHAPGP